MSSLTYKSNQSDTESATFSYAYNNNSQLTEKYVTQNGNSVKTNYAYNNAGLIKTIQQQGQVESGSYVDLFTENYNYNLDGNLYEKIDSEQRKTEYTYDTIGRLISENYSENNAEIWSASYTFDEFDNRTQKVYNDHIASTQSTTLYSYNAANRLTAETVGGSSGYSYTYSYDNSGNLLSKIKEQGDNQTTEIQNTYDAFNRMVETTTPTSSVTYRYDSSGHRTSKTKAGVTTNHFWDGDYIISDQTTGQSTQNYIYGASGIEAIAKSENDGSLSISAYLKNAHGDVVAIQPLGAAESSNYSYDAYGNETAESTNTANPFRYSGQYFDSETGYYYLRARYYDPQIGRFTQEDTYRGDPAEPATLNLYGYCAANPVLYQDPSGHAFETFLDIAGLGFSIYDMCKEPSWLNFGFLMWDVASIVLPGVPGSYAGKAAKAVGKLDDVADICKTAKRVGNVVDTVDDVVDTAKAIKKTASTANKISDLSKAAKKTVDATLSTAKKAAQDATSQFKKLANQTQKAVAELQEKVSKVAKKVDVNIGKFTRSKSSGIKTVEFNGKTVTVNSNLFDLNRIDDKGRTNLQRMQKGRAPIGYDGKPVNIHHIDQTDDGPVMEILATIHQQNYSALHQNRGQSPSLINRAKFNSWKRNYWKFRADTIF